MSVTDFTHILEEIRPWTDYIYLHVKGEPLLHPKLPQLLAAAADYGFYVNITTNGTLLQEKQDILLEYPVRQMNLSLHSFEANDLHPFGMTFHEYIMSTIGFAKAFSPNHGITSFRLWNLSLEDMSDKDIIKNRFILDALTKAFKVEPPLNNHLSEHRGICLAAKTFLSFDKEFQWPDPKARDFGPEGSCHGLKSHIAILCDGTVVPCCLDGNGNIPLGNIQNQPLSEILEAPRSRYMLEGFRNHRISENLCRRCGYRTRFNN